ncbi:hypothetical protein DMN91_002245 [Ooceraea biroi]|uniref:FHOD1 N-terminal GTPase-binding domain-containing protein n=1 Tax=Ooceraea biroi TaxID=2015173 RepID=A0A3L8E0N4_OOCBI|nr:hypothetical protein DMN91_002245 [Ooceraea biroi]
MYRQMFFTCQVQYLNDVDPFSYPTLYPDDDPPNHTFSVTLPLINQLAAVHRLLRAPHRRSRNFGFMAMRLIVRHRQWAAKCTGAPLPPSSCHRITIPQRKRRKSPGTTELSQRAPITGGGIVARVPRDYPYSAERIIDNRFYAAGYCDCNARHAEKLVTLLGLGIGDRNWQCDHRSHLGMWLENQ